jgi:hypothetical protein
MVGEGIPTEEAAAKGSKAEQQEEMDAEAAGSPWGLWNFSTLDVFL